LTVTDALVTKGYALFEEDPAILAWSIAANRAADAVLSDPEMQNTWLRHGKTWFVGVDVLPNDPKGGIGDTPLEGEVIKWLTSQTKLWPSTLHNAQLSVCYPGYPRQDTGETDANHRFRKSRDAAHLDGLLPLGPERRRHLVEPHSVILGLPLNEADPAASPLVVWEGSHVIIRQAFEAAFADTPAQFWSEIDVTAIYQKARREVFETCARVLLPAQPGQATVLHRHVIHGVAPWTAPEEGERRIAYFRPLLEDPADWLALP